MDRRGFEATGSMHKDSKGKCETASHHNLKEKTKNRVDDLQRMFSNLESARKERRTGDVAVFEEQVNQMLREWKVELSEPSPASSLLVCVSYNLTLHIISCHCLFRFVSM